MCLGICVVDESEAVVDNSHVAPGLRFEHDAPAVVSEKPEPAAQAEETSLEDLMAQLSGISK